MSLDKKYVDSEGLKYVINMIAAIASNLNKRIIAIENSFIGEAGVKNVWSETPAATIQMREEIEVLNREIANLQKDLDEGETVEV